MNNKGTPFIIKVISPLHAGSGQDLGIVDLPIQRERHTSFPKIEGSGLKGAIRDTFRRTVKSEHKPSIDLVFGAEKSGDYSGALGFIDAKLLLFPIKSVKGTYSLATCPLILKQLLVNLKIVGIDTALDINFISDDKCLVAEESKVILQDKVILEEYCFIIEENKIEQKLLNLLVKLTSIDNLADRLVILTDDDFTEFVNLSTEVITRTKINPKTGTVIDGALFTEEYLPSESVLYSLAIPSSIFVPFEKKEAFLNGRTDTEAIMEFWKTSIPQFMQIGGNASIGKGIVEIVIPQEEQDA